MGFGSEDAPIRDISPALDKFGIELISNPYKTSLKNLELWCWDNIKRGNLIDFSLTQTYTGFRHSCLLADVCEVDANTNAFKVINGKIFAEKNSVEWLSWRVLNAENYHKGNQRILNKREKTNVCAEITISNTYAIKIL